MQGLGVKRVESIEGDPVYCEKLRARGLAVTCKMLNRHNVRDTLPRADAYFGWLPGGNFDGGGGVDQVMRLLTEELSTRPGKASIFLMFDASQPAEMAALRQMHSSIARISAIADSTCRASSLTKATTRFHLERISATRQKTEAWRSRIHTVRHPCARHVQPDPRTRPKQRDRTIIVSSITNPLAPASQPQPHLNLPNSVWHTDTRPYFGRYGRFGTMHALQCDLEAGDRSTTEAEGAAAAAVPVRTHEGRIPHVAVVGAGPNALRLMACLQPHSALVSVEAFEAEAVGNTISSW